jgi:hypothetical protein
MNQRLMAVSSSVWLRLNAVAIRLIGRPRSKSILMRQVQKDRIWAIVTTDLPILLAQIDLLVLVLEEYEGDLLCSSLKDCYPVGGAIALSSAGAIALLRAEFIPTAKRRSPTTGDRPLQAIRAFCGIGVCCRRGGVRGEGQGWEWL